MAYIYVITNHVNGKQYVGKTSKTIEQRFKEHKKNIYKRTTENRPLYRAMRKYGTENFSIKELEKCSMEDSSEKEIYWIEKLDTYHSGYNATFGGDGKALYNYVELAKVYLERQNIQEVCRIFNCDKNVVSIACKNKGIKVLSSQEISKIKYSKKVMQCNKTNHKKVYNIFNSLMEAATYMVDNNLTGCKHSTIRTHISEVCHGKRKSAAGYYWKFC